MTHSRRLLASEELDTYNDVVSDAFLSKVITVGCVWLAGACDSSFANKIKFAIIIIREDTSAKANAPVPFFPLALGLGFGFALASAFLSSTAGVALFLLWPSGCRKRHLFPSLHSPFFQ